MKILSNSYINITIALLGVVAVVFLISIYNKEPVSLATSTVVSASPATSASLLPLSQASGSFDLELTGSLEPKRTADIVAEQAGTVTYAGVEAGSAVLVGQKLVVLEQDKALADLDLAQASLDSSYVYETTAKVKNENSKLDLIDQIERAQTTLYDVKETKLAQFFSRENELDDFGLEIQDGNTTYYIETHIPKEAERIRVATNDAMSALHDLPTKPYQDLLSDVQKTETALIEFRDLVSVIRNNIQQYTVDDTREHTVYTPLKNMLSSAHADLSTRLSALRGSLQNYHSAQITDADARINQSKAVVRQVTARLSDSVETAPFNGVVAKKSIDQGASVQRGMHLYTIIDPSSWKVRFTVADIFNNSIQKGSIVKLTVDGLPGSYAGVITSVLPEVSKQSRMIVAEAQLEDLPETARAGLFARINLSVQVPEGMYVVPAEYIGHGYNGPYVMTDDGVKVSVTVSRQTEDQMFIRSDELSVEQSLVIPR